jgi:hypothetical protein
MATKHPIGSLAWPPIRVGSRVVAVLVLLAALIACYVPRVPGGEGGPVDRAPLRTIRKDAIVEAPQSLIARSSCIRTLKPHGVCLMCPFNLTQEKIPMHF